MLRNEQEKQEQEKCAILNEVLSLNAQEFRPVRLARTTVSPQ